MENNENKSSELFINNNSNNLIVSFSGLALKFGGIKPFEFLNFLSNNINNSDFLFYIDKSQQWYHNGIDGISNNINETIIYLNNKIQNYNKVIFIGNSAGGYAAILFGSLCNNVNKVCAFLPQTILKNPINPKYKNLKYFINPNVNYTIYGDISITNKNDLHHINHCFNIYIILNKIKNKNRNRNRNRNKNVIIITKRKNVNLIKKNNLIIKNLRDNGELKNIINNLLI